MLCSLLLYRNKGKHKVTQQKALNLSKFYNKFVKFSGWANCIKFTPKACVMVRYGKSEFCTHYDFINLMFHF
uniref:Uncharacterized protein n=1 Tax=Siphoviridae sp. ctAUQ2 TaxID=2826182 RepID=A0A8S5MZM1_9CAUD|nr:MAG TPA: hypothetical protein [Siphoviridae sp. ctAUQ2]